MLQSDTFSRQYNYPLSRLLTAAGACHDARPREPVGRLPGFVQDLDEIREYTYDANLNMASLKHLWDSTTKYNRLYTIESGSNRLEELENTTATTTYTYLYDAVGNMVQENTDRKMTWDYAGRLRTFRTQPDESAASVYAQYLYDAAGERVMKVVSKAGTDDVTTYIDGMFESRVHFDPVGGDEWNEELHIFDGSGRIARLRVGDPFDGDNSPEVIYVLSDHLGSSTVTLEDDGTFYSREEYTPYGESAFGSYEKKRYRFTAKEKDEESGLNYHSARYYAPWLGRWTSADPAGMVDGPSLYAYVRGNPLTRVDPGGRNSQQFAIGGGGDVSMETSGYVGGATPSGQSADSSSAQSGSWGGSCNAWDPRAAPATAANQPSIGVAPPVGESTTLFEAAEKVERSRAIGETLRSNPGAAAAYSATAAAGASKEYSEAAADIAGAAFDVATAPGGGALNAIVRGRAPGQGSTVGQGTDTPLRRAGQLQINQENGRIAETTVNRWSGGTMQVMKQTPMGKRVIDSLSPTGDAREVKVGRTSGSQRIVREAAKDRSLLQSGEIQTQRWIFVESPATGQMGPTAPLRNRLEDYGFGIVEVPRGAVSFPPQGESRVVNSGSHLYWFRGTSK